MIILIILSYLIHLLSCILQNDIIYEDAVPNGRLSVYAELLSYDAGRCLYKCDILIAIQFCNYYSFVTKLDMDYIKDFDIPSFKIQPDGSVLSTNRDYLTCKPLYKENFFITKPSQRFDPGKKILDTYESFNDFLFYSVELGELVHKPGLDYFRTMFFARSFRLRLFTDVNLNIDTYNRIIDKPVKFEIKYFGKCFNGFYGHSCWYECNTDKTQKCDCAVDDYYVTVNCKVTCSTGYLPQTYSYLVFPDVREIVIRCNNRDICARYVSPCPKDLCLPLSNNTYTCENIKFKMSNENETIHYNSQVLFAGEFINVTLDYTSLSEKLKPVASQLYLFLNQSQPVFLDLDIFQYHYTGHHFWVKGGIFDVSYPLNVTIYLQPWNKDIILSNNYRIYSLPHDIHINRAYTNHIIETIVLLNELIECNSSGQPDYRIVYFWESKNIPFINPFGKFKIIDKSMDLINDEITCFVKMIVTNRKTTLFNKTVGVYIQAFENFHWTLSDNVIFIHLNLSCLVTIFVNYTLGIYQMEGETEINTTALNYVNFTNVTGGKYTFLCLLRVENGTFYSRLITFELRKVPSFLCLYTHPHIRGALVQCGHNGNFYDDYRITVRFLVLIETLVSDFYVLTSEGINAVKIPFDTVQTRYMIYCTVEFIGKRFIMNSSSTYQFSTEILQRYQITPEMRKCPDYYPFIQTPDITVEDTTWVILSHPIFYYDPHYHNEFIALSIVIMCMLYCSSAALALMALFCDQEKTGVQLKISIKRSRKNVIKNHIQKRLFNQAMILQDNLFDNYKELYRLSFFNEKYKVSDLVYEDGSMKGSMKGSLRGSVKSFGADRKSKPMMPSSSFKNLKPDEKINKPSHKLEFGKKIKPKEPSHSIKPNDEVDKTKSEPSNITKSKKSSHSIKPNDEVNKREGETSDITKPIKPKSSKKVKDNERKSKKSNKLDN